MGHQAGAGLGHRVLSLALALALHLCSARAAHLRSQLIAFNGSKPAIWQHPHEREVHRREGWTLDELAAVLQGADEQVHVPER